MTLGRVIHPPERISSVFATHLEHFGAPFLLPASRKSVELRQNSVELFLRELLLVESATAEKQSAV